MTINTNMVSMGDPINTNIGGILTNIRNINESGLAANDFEQFLSRFNVALVTADYQIKSTDRIIAVTSSTASITLTLPNNNILIPNDSFKIVDLSKNSNTYPILFNVNGNTINELSVLDPVNKNGDIIDLFYITANKFITSRPTSIISDPTSLNLKTSNYTLVVSDYIIIADTTTGVFNLTLSSAIGIKGKQYIIKKVNSGSNNLTINTTSSQTIDGGLTAILTKQYESITLVSDGANWLII